jgi:histidinol-phosphatase
MYRAELLFAQDVADEAADIALTHFRRSTLQVSTKPDRTLVTEADLAIERLVRDRLDQVFPDDRILGEEQGGSHEPTGRVWVLDPIDGTSNFVRGIPIWGFLLALRVDGEGVLGLADAPALGERYAAVRGHGATRNGSPTRVSAVGRVEDAHVLHGELKDFMAGPYLEPVLALLRDSWRDRGFGDFWAHMLVADGAAEVMLEPIVNLWDFAAPQVIVEEAGGRLTDLEGRPPMHAGPVVTTNGVLHDEVVRRLAAI